MSDSPQTERTGYDTLRSLDGKVHQALSEEGRIAILKLAVAIANEHSSPDDFISDSINYAYNFLLSLIRGEALELVQKRLFLDISRLGRERAVLIKAIRDHDTSFCQDFANVIRASVGFDDVVVSLDKSCKLDCGSNALHFVVTHSSSPRSDSKDAHTDSHSEAGSKTVAYPTPTQQQKETRV